MGPFKHDPTVLMRHLNILMRYLDTLMRFFNMLVHTLTTCVLPGMRLSTKDLLHLPSLVGRSVSWSIGWLVGPFPSNTQVVNVSACETFGYADETFEYAYETNGYAYQTNGYAYETFGYAYIF